MIGFDIHMAGLSKEVSKLVALNGKNAVAYKDLLVVGNGDYASVAQVGDRFYLIIQTVCHQTAVLLDEEGYGSIPCSTNNVVDLYELEGSSYLEGLEIIHAISMEDALKSYNLPWLHESLYQAWVDLDKRSGGYRSSGASLVGMSEEDYSRMFQEVSSWIEGHAHINCEVAA